MRENNWNHSSSKGTWKLWEDLQGKQETIEADSAFQMLSCRCFGRLWLTTPQWWQRCCFFCLGFWELAFLALGFLTSLLSCLGGAPKIDLPLFMFSLAKSVLTSLFSISTLLLGGTKTVVLVEAILEEEKPYPKPVQSEADFWRLSISSRFALEVLSN